MRKNKENMKKLIELFEKLRRRNFRTTWPRYYFDTKDAVFYIEQCLKIKGDPHRKNVIFREFRKGYDIDYFEFDNFPEQNQGKLACIWNDHDISITESVITLNLN